MNNEVLNVITGASSELGKELQKSIGKYQNVIIYNHSIGNYKGAYKIHCNLANPSQLPTIEHGLLDICKKVKPKKINIIHMAGACIYQKLDEKFDAQQWFDLMYVNCIAFYYISKTLFNIISELEGFVEGSFVAVSSNLTTRVNHNNAGYIASKAALEAVVKQLAYDMGEKNIRCNGVAPGYFYSKMSSIVSENMQKTIIQNTPLHRLGNAKDICRVIEFLISEKSTWINGHIITVDGGNTIGY